MKKSTPLGDGTICINCLWDSEFSIPLFTLLSSEAASSRRRITLPYIFPCHVLSSINPTPMQMIESAMLNTGQLIR